MALEVLVDAQYAKQLREWDDSSEGRLTCLAHLTEERSAGSSLADLPDPNRQTVQKKAHSPLLRGRETTRAGTTNHQVVSKRDAPEGQDNGGESKLVAGDGLAANHTHEAFDKGLRDVEYVGLSVIARRR